MNLEAATQAVKHKLGTTWPEPTLTEISREIAEAVAPIVAAAALREAANDWQTGGWASAPPLTGNSRIQAILGMAQRTTVFLRARADDIEQP